MASCIYARRAGCEATRDTIPSVVMVESDRSYFPPLASTFRLFFLLPVILLASLLLAGCWQLDDYATTKTDWKSGKVVEVVERNAQEVERLRIRTAQGDVWSFTSEGPLPFLPAHFRQHQVLGQTVTIFYLTKGDLLVAVHAVD